MDRLRSILLGACLTVLFITACTPRVDRPVIYVTATPPVVVDDGSLPNPFLATYTPSFATATAVVATPNPAFPAANQPTSYVVETGDTVARIAFRFGITEAAIRQLNPGLADEVQEGQTITLPGLPDRTSPNFKIIPDSELVNSPGVGAFDVEEYVRFRPGFLRVYSETIAGRTMTGAEMINFISESTSVNPRLLLALLEYRGGWVTEALPDDADLAYPLGFADDRIAGLFRQLARAADELNAAYYGWRNRGYRTFQLPDGSRAAFALDLNGGTVAIQYFMSVTAPDNATWERDISPTGFLSTYMALFGDPFRYAVEPLVPPDLQQPELTLPFPQGESWFITSGPHGGWDAFGSGWAAVDFAPPRLPDEVLAQVGGCAVSPNYATAVAPGIIARARNGAVVLDLDGDGNERTGWTITYLHIAAQDMIAEGTPVQTGTRIGHPSCEGFYLNSLGTHIHISRRYNGEWISADCWACPGSLVAAPPFIMGGWRVRGYESQAYQGYMERNGQTAYARAGSDAVGNQVFW
jgi:LasA protease